MPSPFPGVVPAALAITLIAGTGAAAPTTAQQTDRTATAPAGPGAAPAQAEARAEEPAGRSPARALADSIGEPALADLAREVLDRNPTLAAVRARARAAGRRAPQVAALPDPMAGLTAFLLSPETRVGPQRAAATLSQRFPWFGRLAEREQAALYRAAAAGAEAEALALELVTETRRLAYELAFLAEWEAILAADRATLERYEELARSRYAAGVGLEQAPIKIQAELTRLDARRLEIEDRRAALAADLNALRDRSALAPLPRVGLPEVRELEPLGLEAEGELDALVREAVAARPELRRAEARLAEAAAEIRLAELERYPDVTVGLSYTLVGRRDDRPGRINPPPDDGDDVLGLSASINLPIWSDRIEAGIEEALARESAAAEERRAEVARIERSLGELGQRLELTRREIRLYDGVLSIQAEESLSSAEAAYTAGTLNALDLLDAERLLLDVRTATARSRADWAITLARLEAAVGRPLLPAAGPGGRVSGAPTESENEGVAP